MGKLFSKANRNYSFSRKKHKGNYCRRCGSELKTLCGFSYCDGCNWDSLTDPCRTPKKDLRNKSESQGEN